MSDYIPMDANESERQLLGSLMIDPDMIDAVSEHVDPEDFADAGLAKLYIALVTLHEAGKPISDWALLKAELPKFGISGKDESVGSVAFIGKLMHEAVNAAHSVFHADEIRLAAQKRRLKELSDDLLRRSMSRATELDHDLAQADATLARIRRETTNGARLVEHVADDVIAELEDSAVAEIRPGTMSGVLPLDSAMGPMMPGELIILAARPGCGKTSLAMQIAQHAAERRRTTLFVSLEMRDMELVRRVLAQASGVDGQSLRSGRLEDSELQLMRDARQSLTDLPLRVWAPSRATTAQIRGIAKHMKATGGLSLIVVDYIGLIKPVADDRKLPRYEQVTAFTAALKAMAKELDVPVLALCQLNREADGQEPRLSHLRESGSIEQDADIVLFVHHPQHPATNSTKDSFLVDIIVAKHRHGATGKAQVFWTPSQCKFSGQQEWAFA